MNNMHIIISYLISAVTVVIGNMNNATVISILFWDCHQLSHRDFFNHVKSVSTTIKKNRNHNGTILNCIRTDTDRSI